MTKNKYIFWTIFNLVVLFSISFLIVTLILSCDSSEKKEMSYTELLEKKQKRVMADSVQTALTYINQDSVRTSQTAIESDIIPDTIVSLPEPKQKDGSSSEKILVKTLLPIPKKQIPVIEAKKKLPIIPLPKIIPEKKEILNCTNSACHEEIMEKRFIHIPVEERDCIKCHTDAALTHSKEPNRPFSETITDVAQRCHTCHKPSSNPNMVHDPVAKGQCLACHDPHQSNTQNLLKNKNSRTACVDCHSLNIEEKNWVHGPVAVAACEVCHISHGSTSNALLAQNKTEICYPCHSIKEEEFESFSFLHGPVAVSCSSCHNPHASDHKYQLVSEKENVCYYCHSDLQKAVSESQSRHEPLQDKNTCYNCHAPHGSNYKYNLINNTFDLCLECHNRNVTIGEITIPAMTKLLKDNPNWHGPIRDKDCSGCHTPHGSENIKLLKLNYPAGFYSEFNVENYKLCFMCHPETNVLDKTTTKLTNFRDGDVNLHFLHVNRKKGRTCRACHEIHASDLAFHIRDAVPFGDWELPINFVPLETGGSCLPGCHRKFEYKR